MLYCCVVGLGPFAAKKLRCRVVGAPGAFGPGKFGFSSSASTYILNVAEIFVVGS